MSIKRIVCALLAVFGIALVVGVQAISSPISSPLDSRASIVKVLNSAGNGGGTGWATVSSVGRPVIVTNDHVCAVEQNGYVVLEQDGGRKAIKRILARNFERDLCVIEGLPIPALELSDSDLARFQSIHVMGHPLLNPMTPSSGQYISDGIMQVAFNPEEDGTCKGGELQSAKKKRAPAVPTPFNVPMGIFGSVCVLSMELSYSTVTIFPGNSGSPVLNDAGEVVGVMNSASPQDNRGNFIPLTYVREILEE